MPVWRVKSHGRNSRGRDFREVVCSLDSLLRAYLTGSEVPVTGSRGAVATGLRLSEGLRSLQTSGKRPYSIWMYLPSSENGLAQVTVLTGRVQGSLGSSGQRTGSSEQGEELELPSMPWCCRDG